MVTGANLTPHMVPEFLTGRPTQSRNKTPHQQSGNDDTLDTTIPARISPVDRQSPGTNTTYLLMVRPVKTATLTFDGKSK